MEKITLSLTGKDSHVIKVKIGQGSFSLGPEQLSKKYKLDAIVEEDQAINWDAFNSQYTPHGEKNAEDYPNGDWPRWFSYFGNDANFGTWSKKRNIEYFTWKPYKSVSADFKEANIHQLTIVAEEDPIHLRLGKNIYRLILEGNLAHFHIEEAGSESVYFYPKTSKQNTHYHLPEFASLKNISYLDVSVSPINQALNCESLLQFKQVKRLSLSGKLANLNVLSQFTQLESLALRYVPDLSELPSLSSWPHLTDFIACNVDADKGKLLRKELKQLSNEREMNKYSSVSQLRTPIWFTTTYGIPFSGWEGKSEKQAVKIYKEAVKHLKKAKTEEEVKTALVNFSQSFNAFPEIDTMQREDIAEAIVQLRQVPSITISAETAMTWFDEVREY